MALSLALSRRASSRPISRQHLGVAFPFRRGSALGPGASMRHSADRISSVFDSLVLIGAIFHHSDLRLPSWLEARLSRLIITPSIHWVHHHRRRLDTDSNYGTIFSFWDRVFGSSSPTGRRPDMAIGVEGAEEGNFLALLLRPFRGPVGS